MELKSLLESASKDVKKLNELKKLAIDLCQFELAAECRRIEKELYPITDEEKLTTEDIESLGFEYDNEVVVYKNVITKNTFCFKSKNNYLIYSFKTNVLSITDKNKKTIVDRILIKNKTELKKLMVQLQINSDGKEM